MYEIGLFGVRVLHRGHLDGSVSPDDVPIGLHSVFEEGSSELSVLGDLVLDILVEFLAASILHADNQ